MKEPRRLVIACDLDGIVTDLHGRWIGLYNEEFGHSMTADDLKVWDMSQNFPHVGEGIYKYLAYPRLFAELDALPGAVEGLRELHAEGHEIHILTAPGREPQTASDKIEWCLSRLPFIRRTFLTVSHQKHRFLSDVLIDDSPNHHREHARSQTDVTRIAIAWPFNEITKDLVSLRAESYKDTKTAWRQIVDRIKLESESHL